MSREGAGTTRMLTEHVPLILEMTLCREFDNFEVYLAELMAQIFRKRPETLKSAQTETHEVILQFGSMQELRVALAERRVQSVSREGMKALTREFERRFGLPLFRTETDLRRAIKIGETRNIIVHKRGAVDARSLRRAPSLGAEPGERLVVDPECVVPDLRFLVDTVLDVDRRALRKFNLPEVLLE